MGNSRQQWRLDILEGHKASIYPILEWIFDNIDRLKERVYLAQFLTRIEVPIEEQQHPDIKSLMIQVDQKMEEFKVPHFIIQFLIFTY